MKYLAGTLSAALALVSAVTAQDLDSTFEKRDNCGQPVLVQAAAAPYQPQVQAVQPCQPQVQAVQPVVIQAAPPPCAPQVQEQYVPPAVVYQQPVLQQPVLQAQPVYQQPVYQPQPVPQPYYYPPPPPPPQEDSNPGCYSQFGNGLASTSGRLLRYILCPWSLFADQCDNDNNNNGGYYPQPYYPQPYYVPQPAPQPQYVPQYGAAQPPQGQWYYSVVPVQSQQSAVLQPVHPSLVPEYGLPNGYGIATTANVVPCN